jgi:hypothetical protein
MGSSFVQQLEVTLIGSVRGGKGRYREGLFTGTYRDPDKLYRPMIDGFLPNSTECSIEIHSHITTKMSASRRATATTWLSAIG